MNPQILRLNYNKIEHQNNQQQQKYFAGCAANQMLIKKLKTSLMINKK